MSDYSWIGPLIQAGAGAIGNAQQQGGAEAQNKLLEDAYKRALAMLESGQLSYTPERVEDIGPSAMGGVEADPVAKLAQRDALLKLQEQARTGFSTIDKAAMNRAMMEAGQQERSNREAILARLQPGSGAAISARLQAQQSAANRGNQAALDIAAEAQKRKLAALGRLGDLSGDVRRQSFGEGKARADAMDAISRFNAETSRFNTQQSSLAQAQAIQNRLGALELAGGAGGRLGAGRANLADIQARGTVNGGQAISGGVNAINEGTKTDASGNVYYSEPEEWEQW